MRAVHVLLLSLASQAAAAQARAEVAPFARDGEAIASAVPVLAQAEAKKVKVKKKAAPAKAEESRAEAEDVSGKGSSWEARDGKRGGVGLRLGTIVSSLTGGGLDAFAAHKGSLQYGLFYGSGSVDLSKDVEDKDKYPDIMVKQAAMSARLILVQARYFFGNSFYVGGGLGHRAINVKYAIEDLRSQDAVAGEVNADSVVAHAAIGNLWAWKNGFYLGADWFAITLPLSHSYSASTTASQNVSSELDSLQKTTEDLGEALGKATSFQLALFHIGWMF